MDQGLVDEEREPERRLVGLLAELVRERGQKGAAAALGVGYHTVRRSLAQPALSQRLRLALERYAFFQDGGDVPESPLVQRLEALEARVQAGEEVRKAVVGGTEQERERLTTYRQEVDRSVDGLSRAMADMRRDLKALDDLVQMLMTKPDRPDNAAQTTHGAFQQAGDTGVSIGVTFVNAPGPGPGPERAELLREWDEARTWEAGARTRLERAAAGERRLDIEIRLIRDHDLPVPPDANPWGPTVRSRELAWRWEALDDRRRERRRYQCLRLARRVLTLGLWWS